ncbi:MAG TPA: type II toxin-antitoxin system ParD family antitoxin [Longimicrobiales bacterium]|nr:type II toxin-antitoxin system ParD family antitoxin [Longimicrobiales bacterium]
MNISLPESLKGFVERQVAERGYGTTSEYVRELIRREQERDALRAALLQGAASPVVATADAEYFQSLRDRILASPAE